MGFWKLQSCGSISKKELAKNPVCICGNSAKLMVSVVELDWDGEISDAESFPVCRACQRRDHSGRNSGISREDRRRARIEWRQQEERRNYWLNVNPEFVRRMDQLGRTL